MRTPNVSTAYYVPNHVPDDPAEVQRFLREELNRIAAVVRILADGHIDKSYAAPAKPRDGDIRYADGTTWNPGSGQGVYYCKGTTWTLLG